jgi:hypothetical protein
MARPARGAVARMTMLSAVPVGAATVGASDESPPLAFFELLFQRYY